MTTEHHFACDDNGWDHPGECVLELCQWFAMCDHPATTTRNHPILGEVPICDRCNAKITELELPDLTVRIMRNFRNGNFADVRTALTALTPMEAARTAAIVSAALRPTEHEAFIRVLR